MTVIHIRDLSRPGLVHYRPRWANRVIAAIFDRSFDDEGFYTPMNPPRVHTSWWRGHHVINVELPTEERTL